MTRQEFIKVLEKNGYSYHEEGERIIVDHKGYVSLDSLKSLPAGVEFENGGRVWLPSLTSLPAGVEFNNGEFVWLNALTSLPAGVQFKNGGGVWLRSLTSLPAGVQFRNRGYVSLNALSKLPLEDLDYTFQNSGIVYIEDIDIKEVEFPESRWVPVKTRRVKTFESFTSDI
jgi:hypothetical protein